jgi:hypothetical protein
MSISSEQFDKANKLALKIIRLFNDGNVSPDIALHAMSLVIAMVIAYPPSRLSANDPMETLIANLRATAKVVSGEAKRSKMQ